MNLKIEVFRFAFNCDASLTADNQKSVDTHLHDVYSRLIETGNYKARKSYSELLESVKRTDIVLGSAEPASIANRWIVVTYN